MAPKGIDKNHKLVLLSSVDGCLFYSPLFLASSRDIDLLKLRSVIVIHRCVHAQKSGSTPLTVLMQVPRL